MKTYFVLVIVAHLACAASALKCYQCSSGDEPTDCGPKVDDKFIEDCEDPLDCCVLGIFEYSKTRAIKFVRQCGETKESEALCEGEDGVKVWGCNICSEDSCNGDSSGKYLSGANEITPISGAIFFFTALARSIS